MASVRPIELLLDTDNVLEIPALTNALSGEAVSGAVVEVTLLNEAGDDVAGQGWPATFAEDGLVDGHYTCVLNAALALTENQPVTIVVVADAGAGLKRTWYVSAVARRGR